MKLCNFTEVERVIMTLSAGNRTTQQIADFLSVSVETVNQRRHVLRIKLGVRNGDSSAAGVNAMRAFVAKHKLELPEGAPAVIVPPRAARPAKRAHPPVTGRTSTATPGPGPTTITLTDNEPVLHELRLLTRQLT